MIKNPITIALEVTGEYSDNELSKIMDDIWQRYPRAQVAKRRKGKIIFEVF